MMLLIGVELLLLLLLLLLLVVVVGVVMLLLLLMMVLEVVVVVKEGSSFSNQLSNRHGRGLTSTSALDQHRTDTGQRTCRDEVPVAAWGDQRGG